MKKIITILAAALVSIGANAQRSMHGHIPVNPTISEKPAAIGDTLTMSNIAATNTTRVLYAITPSGSGYTTGTNVYNDKGFAERYTFNAGDSSVSVLGVMALFGGNVSATSTKNVTLKIWGQSSTQMITSRLYYEGFPEGVLDSVVVPATQLGIGTTADTLKPFFFPAPTGYLKDAFFAGYTINYNFTTLGTDTIALKTSLDGARTTADYKLRYIKSTTGDTIATDTLINVQNATLWSDGRWHDNYTENDSLYNHLAIFPIVLIGGPTGISNVTHQELSLTGAFPNPSNKNTNIGFSLSAPSAVTITVTDMAGRAIQEINTGHLSAGNHNVSINTAHIPTGSYIYLVRTASGSGLAGKMQVVHN
jgi:hypothetical protein